MHAVSVGQEEMRPEHSVAGSGSGGFRPKTSTATPPAAGKSSKRKEPRLLLVQGQLGTT